MAERWTFIRHENGATTWHEGTNGVSPPFGVKVEVVPAESETGTRFLEWLLAEARWERDKAKAEVVRLRQVIADLRAVPNW